MSGRRWRFPTPVGMALVFRYQMRNRNAWRDLAYTGLLLAAMAGLALWMQVRWTHIPAYSNNVGPPFLLGWLVMEGVSGALILLPMAALLGAQAVPPSSEFEAIQSALLTRLTAFDLVAGRLLAALWPVVSAGLAACAFWLAAQLGWRFVEGGGRGFVPILLAHLVLLSAVGMIGSLGFLFAQRQRPGRNWGRGAGAALGIAALCVAGILFANPLIVRMQKPGWLIELLLLINPVSAAVTAFGPDFDILRDPWLYDRTNAHDYQFAYPPAWATVSVFLLIGSVCLCLAASRLRRAYR